MKRSITHALAALALGFAAPVWAETIEYPGDDALLRTISGGFTNAFAPSGTDGPTYLDVISNSLADNVVTVNPIPAGLTVPGYVLGAINNTSGSDDVRRNKVFIKTDLPSSIAYGGTASATDATDNFVSLSPQASINGIRGGVSLNGNALRNHIVIDGGSAATAEGGSASGAGDATGNLVEILNGGTVTQVTGGRSVNGNATGNTVRLGGASNPGGASIFGGSWDNTGGCNTGKDCFSGNTLELKDYTGTQTALALKNFEFYRFLLSNASQPLKLSGGVISSVVFSGVDFTGPAGAASRVSSIDLAPGTIALLQVPSAIPLICVTGTGSFTGTIGNYGVNFSASGYIFLLLQGADCLYASVTPSLPALGLSSSSTMILPTARSVGFEILSPAPIDAGWTVVADTDPCPATPATYGSLPGAGTLAGRVDNLTPDTAYKLCFVAAGTGRAVDRWDMPFTTLVESLTLPAISVTAPASGVAPNAAVVTCGANFTCGAVTWTPNDNPFQAGTQYTATVTLTANSGYTFTGLVSATINGNNATVTNNTGNTVTLSYQFGPLGAGPGASATGIPALNPAMLVLLAMVLTGAALRRGR